MSTKRIEGYDTDGRSASRARATARAAPRVGARRASRRRIGGCAYARMLRTDSGAAHAVRRARRKAFARRRTYGDTTGR